MEQAEKSKGTSLDHVLKYTGVLGGVQGLNILISIIRNKLTSKLLGAVGIGRMSFFVSISEFINYCSNLGISISTTQHLSELVEEGEETRIINYIKVVRTWGAWTALIGFLLCIVAALLYDWQIVLLSPMVIATMISAIELSILKGLRRLKRVAMVSAIGAITTFLTTIPFFWAFGLNGILISLDCSAISITAIHLAFTTPLYPWRVSLLSRDIFLKGLPLLRIGIPFIISGIAGATMNVLQQGFLKEQSSEAILGFYRVGYTIMVTYAGIVFTALDADYFPRLSSVNQDLVRRNATINQQIRACLLLIPPMLIALIVTMPIIVRLLYTEEFLPAVEFTIFGVFYMFFRCLSVPIGYTALARGDSKTYMVMEIIYDTVALSIFILSFQQWGLRGIGIGLSAASVFDLLLVGLTYGFRYRFRFESSTFKLTLFQGIVLTSAIFACLLLPLVWKYFVGALLFTLSLIRSYMVLRKESDVIQKFHNKLHV